MEVSSQMNYLDRPFFVRKSLEFYWTITRFLGLSRWHGEEERLFMSIFYYPSYCLAQILVRTNIRFIEMPEFIIDHLGRLAISLDSYFKDQIIINRKVRPVFLGAAHSANTVLLSVWPPCFSVRNEFFLVLLKPLLYHFPVLKEPILIYCDVDRGSSRAHLVQKRWGARPPLATLHKSYIARGEAALRALGIPDGAWFVCVDSREDGYAAKDNGTGPRRSSDISSFMDAMKLIVARGGWCIRLGDATMEALPPMTGVIDYAHSSERADWMDVFLCARCRFFLGSPSRLFGVAGIFGRPSALANVEPLGVVYSPFVKDKSIPRLALGADDKAIPFEKLFSDEALKSIRGNDIKQHRVSSIDNTSQDILELTAEMFEQLDHDVLPENSDDELQAHFRALLRPQHHCWHAASQVGGRFLRRHRSLLSVTGPH